jgi:hypothetical protein
MEKINIKLVLIILLAGFLGVYFLYQSREYLSGPEIIIESPFSGEVVRQSYLEVRGQAINVSSLSLNGRQIFTNERGNFEEGLLLARGYNIIEVAATDKFGRVKKEKREVILE